MTDLPPLEPDMLAHMASVATSRSRGWDIVSQLFAPVTDDLVEALRDGSAVAQLIDSMEWTGEGSQRLLVAARHFLPYERAAATRSLPADRIDLEHGNDGSPALSARCAAQRDLCIAEAEAWESGDEEAGRQARLQQFKDLDGELLDDLVAHCDNLVTGLHSEIHGHIARIAIAFLALESGRNLPDPIQF